MKEKEEGAVMYEKCEKPDLCPVKSFELYFSKLNPLCDSLFQRPKKYANMKDAEWHDNKSSIKMMFHCCPFYVDSDHLQISSHYVVTLITLWGIAPF